VEALTGSLHAFILESAEDLVLVPEELRYWLPAPKSKLYIRDPLAGSLLGSPARISEMPAGVRRSPELSGVDRRCAGVPEESPSALCATSPECAYSPLPSRRTHFHWRKLFAPAGRRQRWASIPPSFSSSDSESLFAKGLFVFKYFW